MERGAWPIFYYYRSRRCHSPCLYIYIYSLLSFLLNWTVTQTHPPLCASFSCSVLAAATAACWGNKSLYMWTREWGEGEAGGTIVHMQWWTLFTILLLARSLACVCRSPREEERRLEWKKVWRPNEFWHAIKSTFGNDTKDIYWAARECMSMLWCCIPLQSSARSLRHLKNWISLIDFIEIFTRETFPFWSFWGSRENYY